MARFKVSGNYYVSQWGGNDANAGTDPDLPKASIASSPNVVGVHVIGSGVYKGNTLTTVSKAFIGDGRVIIDGLGGNLSGSNNGCSWKNIWLRNCSNISQTNIPESTTDCIFEQILGNASPGNAPSVSRCVFLPSANPWTSPGGFSLFNCLIFNQINVVVTTNAGINGSFIAKNVITTWTATYVPGTAAFDNNCVNGIISRNGINYELKQLSDGSARPDADGSILDIVTVFPAVYTRGNFACVDPEFIDIYSKTVLPTSPLLKRTSGGYFIGAVRPAQIVRLDDAGFQFTYTNINLTNPLAVGTNIGQPYGRVRITGKLSDTPTSFGKFSLRTVLAFNKNDAGGSVGNNNVPDAVRLLGLLPGNIDKPRRLTYLMRTSLSTTASQASPDSVWDNDGALVGDYLLHEDNTVPQHAPFGGNIYGNGDPRGIGATLSNFNFCSVDIIVILDQERV